MFKPSNDQLITECRTYFNFFVRSELPEIIKQIGKRYKNCQDIICYSGVNNSL